MINLQDIFEQNENKNSYLTHSLHPYPAKFPPPLPRYLLKHFAHPGQTVLDPFCGSGTTLVEARITGINAIGVDVNGLSVLLSKVKATPLSSAQLKEIENFVSEVKNDTFYWSFGNKPVIKVREIEGLNHWFQANVADEISFLLDKIDLHPDEDVKDFLKIILSSIIVRISKQESDTRFAAIDKETKDCLTFELFVTRATEYVRKMAEFSALVSTETTLEVRNADSRDLSFLEKNQIDLIITSPPYANTYDYYLYHKFRKRWLGLDVGFAQNNEIGSRREFSSLKKSPSKWNEDLIKCFSQMNTVLKPGGFAFIVIGDSIINKELIKIDEIIIEFAPSIGFSVDEVISSDLAKHSRIFNPLFAKKGKKEHLIKLRKTI
jgi:site-specific DNA-methyltransferase (cytosine-N4-specific)